MGTFGRLLVALLLVPPTTAAEQAGPLVDRSGETARQGIVAQGTVTAWQSASHPTAWVGRYEDLVAGTPSGYLVNKLHSQARVDHPYPGLERRPTARSSPPPTSRIAKGRSCTPSSAYDS
jgi:hypothetical protein